MRSLSTGLNPFRCFALWAQQQKGPASCRALNVVSTRFKPCLRRRGLKPYRSNQSANGSGIIIRADSSALATIPFIVANLLSQSLLFKTVFRPNPSVNISAPTHPIY